MANWNAVKLTQAKQVAELQGIDELELPPPEIGTADHYRALCVEGAKLAALDFIGHALPRFELVAWAAHILDSESRSRALPMRDRQVLDHALRWLGDPDDAKRRSAYDSAMRASNNSAEKLLGMAVFFSGGSISLPDLAPVLPEPGMAARFGVNAVKVAAYRSEDSAALIDRALKLAEEVAERGERALDPV